jgi:methionine sulfoxide reductase heme-binding subunit
MPVIAAAGTPALWYLSRGSGAVSLILLSTSVVLGIVDQRRWRTPRWPRFAFHSLHRWVSLFALAFLSVHILSGVLDSFAPIRLLDAVIPFAGNYRPLWLGLGALSLDMLLAVAITSLLRKRIGQRAWRAVHWLSYGAWPVAVMHGLGTGSDVRSGWLLAVSAGCVAAVWMAVLVRVSGAVPRARVAGFGALAALPLAAVLWLAQGPLAGGWAGRAGTPARLLLARNVTPARSEAAFPSSFSGYLGGTASQTTGSGGLSTVRLAMHFTGGAGGSAEVLLEGAPLEGGGVSVQRSQVTIGPRSEPTRYRGSVVSLDGGQLVARVSDRTGNSLRVEFRITLEQAKVRGSLSVVRE